MFRALATIALALMLRQGIAMAQSHGAHKKAAYAAFELGKYSEAIKQFEQAYQLKRDPRLLYNLALAYYRRYEVQRARTDLQQARHLFRRFLLLVAPPKKGVDRRRILEARRYSQDFLRKVDSELHAVRPAPRPTSQPTTRPLKTDGLEPASVPTTSPTTDPRVPPRPPQASGSITHWLLYGLAAATGVAAAITGGLALSADTRSDELAARGDVAANGQADRARSLALATDMLLGAAVGAAIAGLILHLLAPAGQERRVTVSTRWRLLWSGPSAALRLTF